LKNGSEIVSDGFLVDVLEAKEPADPFFEIRGEEFSESGFDFGVRGFLATLFAILGPDLEAEVAESRQEVRLALGSDDFCLNFRLSVSRV
jgi:hypothetical protein